MAPTPLQQNFMVFLKSTKPSCLCTQKFQLMVQQHTTLPNSPLKFFQIAVAKLYPLLKSKNLIQKIKHLSTNPEEKTLVSFYVSALFTSIPVPVALQVIKSKISTCTNSTVSSRSLQKNSSSFWYLQSPTAFSTSISNSIDNYRAHSWVCFESIAIHTSPTLVKWWFTYVNDVHSTTMKRSSQQTSTPPHPHKSTH